MVAPTGECPDRRAMSSAVSDVASAGLDAKIDIAVARKALDATEQQGKAAVALIQDAVELQKDIAHGRPIEPGTLDVTA